MYSLGSYVFKDYLRNGYYESIIIVLCLNSLLKFIINCSIIISIKTNSDKPRNSGAFRPLVGI